MNTAILITVRTGSTRLPGKSLLKINGKSTIEHLITRVKKSKLACKIILCTTVLPEDDILYDISKKHNILCYRGSVKDKLQRWEGACKKHNIEFFITADGDDLFCEPKLIDLAFRQYKNTQADFIKSDKLICGSFTYGIKSSALSKVCQIKNTNDTEMMWPYFTDTGLFKVENLQNTPLQFQRNDIRMTLDYEDDFLFFKKIIEHFSQKEFDLFDIVYYIDTNPEIKKINFYLEEKWKSNQVAKTKLILKDDK